MWWKIAPILLLTTVQISNSGIPLDVTARPNNTTTIETFRSHRIIKRFTTKLKIPRPQLPTLPRPTFPFPVFSRELPKGENGDIPKSKKQGRRPSKPSQPKEVTNEERTLLAAKKALILKKVILAKKAIILAKLKKKALKKKKWKKKAALAYGLHKLSKVKGFTLKAPNLQVSFGPPSKKGKKAAATQAEKVAYNAEDENENSSGEDSDSNEDDDDDDEDIDKDEDDYDEDDSKQQVEANTYSQDNSSNSMMQQLQQQLQQTEEQTNQNQSSPELLQSQEHLEAVVVTPPPPGLTTESTETYSSSKKAAKKAKKKAKKKGKVTPRPVNLGVKANLYKNFDKMTKKAQNKLSSFVQIDIDFFRSGLTGRSAIDDLVMEPKRLVSRTSKVSSNSYESKEGYDYDYGGEVEIPRNFAPSWKAPEWRKEYPTTPFVHNKKNLCEEGVGSCNLKPVYIIFKQDM